VKRHDFEQCSLLLTIFILKHMTRHRPLVRTPRQQEVRTRRSSLYHSPPQRSSVANPVASNRVITSEDNRAAAESSGTSEDLPPRARTQQLARGLNEATQRKLLEDIEKNGGLQIFSLARLVKEKPDTYGGKRVNGSQDTALKRQVQNCVKEWKRLEEAQYLLLLNHYGVRAVSLQSSFYIPDQPVGAASPVPLISNPEPIPATPPIIEPSSIDQVSTLPSITTTNFISPPARVSRSATTMNYSSALVVRPAPGNHNDEVEGMCGARFLRDNYILQT
jgi:hypothetical protein